MPSKPVRQPVAKQVAKKVVRKPRPVGFNPQKMARTLTDLGYDSDIRAIQQAIDENARNELAAMASLRDWTAQAETQRAAGQTAVQQAFDSAVAGSEQSGANIANLFGEQARGEALANAQPGVNALRGSGASNVGFLASMAPILQAQGLDLTRRAQSEYGDARRDLTGDLLAKQSEKGKAYQANLLEAMRLGWEREGQLHGQRMDSLQARQAQQALNQASALAGPQLTAAKLQNQATRQGIRLNEQEAKWAAQEAAQRTKVSELQLKREQAALQKSRLEIQQMQQGGGGEGFDLSNPANAAQVAQGALSGALGPRGALIINPRIAWENMQHVLAGIGLGGNPRAQQAAMNAFAVSLNLSHGRKMWPEYQLKNGKLIYNPTKRKKKGKAAGGKAGKSKTGGFNHGENFLPGAGPLGGSLGSGELD